MAIGVQLGMVPQSAAAARVSVRGYQSAGHGPRVIRLEHGEIKIDGPTGDIAHATSTHS